MLQRICIPLLFSCLTFTLSAVSGPIMSAIEKVEKTDQYAYILTRIAENKKSVERHDPTIKDDLKWELLLKEDKEPTENDKRDYKREKKDQIKQRGGSMELEDMIKMPTLTLLKETSQEYIYTFQAQSTENEMFNDLKGKIHVDKTGEYITTLILYNDKELSPAFGVSITTFKMEMSFSPLKTEGPYLLDEIKTTIKGSAFLIGINVDSTAFYSDYSFKG